VLVEVDTVEIGSDGILCRGMTQNQEGRTIRVQFVGDQGHVRMAVLAGDGPFFAEVDPRETTLIDGEVTGPSG
jgi:hypothetical protein